MSEERRNNFDLLRLFAASQVVWFHSWLAGYLAIASLAIHFGVSMGNHLNVLLYVLLAFTVTSLAHTKRELSERLLRRNDVSYGTYLYHMVIVNVLYELGYKGSALLLPLVFVLTYAVAMLSWMYIEKPSLSLKRRALRRFTSELTSSHRESAPGAD